MSLSSKPESSEDPLEEARRACRKQALDLLARREHSRLELRRKLLARSHAEDLVDEVLDRLQQERLLDEARFAEQFVRSRTGRGQGPAKIRAQLLQRGVGELLIDTALAEAECDWAALAAAARRKRFGAASPDAYRERARQARFLKSRGFEYGQIQAALDLEADSD
ncbi:MAG: regulatory protein RecX [Rhodospirillaceae bacterium]|nr:regulatory protein RecX [Rhodospirillaceae bacterium]MDE0363135.1 regulatory protein RecX [Rhodospirillaceae bacterium]